ncbi:cadmium-translocating P-type ATPase [Devosia sp. PTR5]|uniref:Cadmium-translocating P-type ATPase n=1 Tax=Devosia oryzisoli TaxID=2774138 RepID=A0A927IU48_9HYPH|nr:heavy metal translocating P-type ATPase [Devosia oryzisoli]MBD8067234.1 cadmium-translocating P-type ATPase [Devosia oryzisoli]
MGISPTLEREASELLLASRLDKNGLQRTELSVPDVHCGACIRRVEKVLGALPGVEQARLNLSTRRATVHWTGDQPPPLRAALEKAGYPATYVDDVPEAKDPELGRLVRALAVAGFSASNIMLLSVSVWSGADPETRQVFYWISAALALPTLLYSGRIFFASAWKALRHGRTNMDVPISIGVVLAFALSLFETLTHGDHAYFDAAVTLLFFLLIGRTLDHMMRERARTAVKGLSKLAARGATVVQENGSTSYVPIADVRPGMDLLITSGERIPVDGTLEEGISELDVSMVTGESAPLTVGPGADLRAGTLNLGAPIRMKATAAASDSFLAEMVRLMEVAEGGRARYRRIADRAAQLYSPVVHLTALLTFAGWMVVNGDWHHSISTAITVLIITCPCALGLAVPIVQVMAARRLFELGVMVKDGSALERVSEVDAVVLDKTGTMTLGKPVLVNRSDIAPAALAIAASLAAYSSHPISRALVAEKPPQPVPVILTAISESPGNGVEAQSANVTYRLGRAGWALGSEPGAAMPAGTVLARDGELLGRFDFSDRLRSDAKAAVAALRAMGLPVTVVSGDRDEIVARAAAEVDASGHVAGVLPAEKLAYLEKAKAEGRKTLMVGDGLNDAPALAGAHVSMAPASAADVGRNAADFVFLREGLSAIPHTIAVATASGRLIRQNLGFAVLYNAVAVPLAILGYVTPLVAALAMSASSIVVVANALRLPAPAGARPAASAREDAVPASNLAAAE